MPILLLPALQKRRESDAKKGPKEREGETSEGDVANGEMVGVWMDGRGQIKGGRRRW